MAHVVDDVNTPCDVMIFKKLKKKIQTTHGNFEGVEPHTGVILSDLKIVEIFLIILFEKFLPFLKVIQRNSNDIKLSHAVLFST